MSAAENLPVEYPEQLLAPILNFQLAMDVALGADEALILDAYDLQAHELAAVKKSAIFRQNLQRVEKQISEDGGAFKLKAQVQAEEMLKEAYKMAVDPDMDPRVRKDLIVSQVRWAGYDAPKTDSGAGNAGFAVHIHLGGSEPREINTFEHEE